MSKPSVALDTTQRKLRDDCIKVVREGLKTSLDVASALMQLRDDKLYVETHATFVDFIKAEFQIDRSYAYRLIGAAEVRASLPKRIAAKLTNERQARALVDIEEDKRVEVIQIAAATGEVSAASIQAASSKLLSPMGDKKSLGKIEESEKATEPKDEMGYPIPKRLREPWVQAEQAVRELLASISNARCLARKGIESKDLWWRHSSSNNILLGLDNAYQAAKAGLPYAVCFYCQGQTIDKCTSCRGTGYIGKHLLTTVPSEFIELREKSMKK